MAEQMQNGWRPMKDAPTEGTNVELWVEHSSGSGGFLVGCRFSPQYGWLYNNGRKIPMEPVAWRPETKGPYG